MRVRRGQTVLASVALVSLGLLAPVSSGAGALVPTVRPIPLARQNAVMTDLNFPPTPAESPATPSRAGSMPNSLALAVTYLSDATASARP